MIKDEDEEKCFLKTLLKKEKILLTRISSFSSNVFYLMNDKFQFFQLHLFCHQSAYAFNLGRSKILLSGKCLNLLQQSQNAFNSLPNVKILSLSKLKAFADDKINVI